VYVQNAEDGVVSGNVLVEPYTAGVGIYSDVRRYVVTGNTVINPKGPGIAGGGATDFPSCVLFSGTNFLSVVLSGNTFVRDNAALAAKVGEVGVVVANTAAKAITADNNTFTGLVLDWAIPEATGVVGDFTWQFTGTITGCTTSPTGSVRYSKKNGVVTLSVDAAITGTSNTDALTLTGMPAFLFPTGNRYAIVRVIDNGVSSFGVGVVSSTGVISFFKDASLQVFTASGTKGVPQFTFTYVV
jgi:hypothetical protein